MRNLKRALSLALAAIMLIGMMVVSASATGLDDFPTRTKSSTRMPFPCSLLWA